jgi:hypothetical protein
MCSLNRITPDRQRAEIGRNAEHTLLSRKTGAGALRGSVLAALGRSPGFAPRRMRST